MNEISRTDLAALLKRERHRVIAEHILAGADPVRELADYDGAGLRKALRSSKFDDSQTRHARATFQAIVNGEMEVVD